MSFFYVHVVIVVDTQLTANEHENDREDLLVVGVGCNVAETHGDETGEAKVEASAVPTLVEGGDDSGDDSGEVEVESGESEFSQKNTQSAFLFFCELPVPTCSVFALFTSKDTTGTWSGFNW